jgi:hypothetical protein
VLNRKPVSYLTILIFILEICPDDDNENNKDSDSNCSVSNYNVNCSISRQLVDWKQDYYYNPQKFPVELQMH